MISWKASWLIAVLLVMVIIGILLYISRTEEESPLPDLPKIGDWRPIP